MNVGESIRKIRREHDLTQEQLGRIAGVTAMAVSQWENGRAVPRMGAIQLMADYFGIPKSAIMGDAREYAVAEMQERQYSALTADERELLGIYRRLDDTGRETALRLLTALSPRAGDTGSVSEARLA